MKRTWEILKEINCNRFLKSINFNGKAIKKNSQIAKDFNKYFVNVGTVLANRIQNTSKTFEDFLFSVEENTEYRDFTFEEFEKASKSVKRSKAAGHDDIDSNVINKVYDELVIHHL